MKKILSLAFLVGYAAAVCAQKPPVKNLVYADKDGVLRYTADNREAAFFGVNYTVPFAYGYRSHKALNVDLEKAIDADVYHMARLGLDAFRVHVWDVEISDSLGNLLANEHLRLFDYLLKKLKEHKIKILITPIAFWGNGYPEPDVRTNGFSYVYTKGGSVVREEAFRAQENYLKQFFTHINPYTGLTYKDDSDVIAMEINNEPHHSGPKVRTTEYVNRMAAAVRSTGWTKPVFYNISESPLYADAVVKANVDGHSFQWYPTGLVVGHEQKGNFLPNVDVYRIPFADTIPAFRNRAKMVYEFDAGDVMHPIMYPAMARSFRTAGFQWATQFAYDPMATAYANTEYQTHYLNLAYTPAKAISLLIASKVFHRVPRGKSYGAYPVDTLFDVFRISYREALSEMNSDEEFYYSNNTTTQPKNSVKLKHIAGVGNSTVVKYEGSGAYFLDKLSDGAWRLEVMPDVVHLDDPFKKASLRKPVVRTVFRQNAMQLFIKDIQQNFFIAGLDNNARFTANGNAFSIAPGSYIISRDQRAAMDHPTLGHTFVAPASVNEMSVTHVPLNEATSSKSFSIVSSVAGIDTSVSVSLELRNTANKWHTMPMQRHSGFQYRADVPAEMVTSGLLSYRFIVRQKDGETYTFPGGFKGDPYAWDEWRTETYQTFVAAHDSPLQLFNPTTDRGLLMPYNPDWRTNTVEYTAADQPGRLSLKATIKEAKPGNFMGWQAFFAEKISGRQTELPSQTTLVVKARASQTLPAKVALIDRDGAAFSATVTVGTAWQEIEISLSRLKRDSALLLPRPYPGFQPLRFLSATSKAFSLSDIEKLEFSFGENLSASRPVSIEVESVYLKK